MNKKNGDVSKSQDAHTKAFSFLFRALCMAGETTPTGKKRKKLKNETNSQVMGGGASTMSLQEFSVGLAPVPVGRVEWWGRSTLWVEHWEWWPSWWRRITYLALVLR